MSHEKGCGIGAEFPHSHIFQIFFIILFVFSWIIDGLVFHLSINFGILLLDIIRIILFGLTFILAYWLIKKSGFIVSDEVIEKREIISHGIYARSRNPMYLGVLLLYLAFVFLTMSLICLISWIIITIFYNIMVSYEEMELEKIFGNDFIEYKKKVRKWIPKVKG